jgi:hypothetical protein
MLVGGMLDMRQVEGLRAESSGFVADVFASVPRKDQRAKGDCYLRGLTLDGGESRSSRWRSGCRTATSRTCSSS